MKRTEIKVGGIYIAKVGSNITRVRVDGINEHNFARLVGESAISYDVTNLKTGRKTTFRSAAKFRSEVKEGGVKKAATVMTPKEHTVDASGEYCSCGQDAVTCQKHGRRVCGNSTTWVEGTGNVCLGCIQKAAYEVALLKELDTPTGGQHGPCPMPDNEPAVQMPTDAELGIAEGEKRLPFSAPTASSTTPPSSNVSLGGDKLGDVFAPPPARPADWLTSIAGYTPTEEQKAILTLADELQRSEASGRVMVIGAGAGTGKTSTLRMLETILSGSGQYTAFNSALVAESKTKFKKAACNTTHSLAFKTVGKLYSHRLNSNRVRSYQVASMLGIESIQINVPDPQNPGMMKPKMLDGGFLAGQLMQAVKKFCQSAEREIDAKHFRYIDGIDTSVVDGKRSYTNNNVVVEYLLPFAKTAWADLSSVDGKLPFSHDVYVKVWQLGEGDKKPYIPASYILLDEAQDTAPVLLDILKQQTHALVILVGDDNQQIYEWRGAVNAMGAYPGAPRRLLSQSFRFGQTVADVANSILATLEQPTDLVMKGFLNIPSRVAEVAKPTCILCRTNAMAIGKFLEAIAAGGKPFIVGGSAETIEFCKAAIELQANRPTRHPELSCFESWTEVQAYVKTDEGEDLKLMVKLVTDFGARTILEALEKMPREEDADLVLSTAHRSKGREWKSVKLAQDFPPATRMSDADHRLLYVAITRAQHTLDISECPPFCGGRSKTTGEEFSALNIRYTISMPSVEALMTYESNKKEEPKVPANHGPAIIAVQKAPNGWVPAPDKPRDTEFTWTKLGDKYVIRGPQGHENKTVTVNRRNGTTATVRIGAAIEKKPDVWLYAI